MFVNKMNEVLPTDSTVTDTTPIGCILHNHSEIALVHLNKQFHYTVG